jgi:tetratricopeptide (TPR) repeat protein
MGTRPGRTSPSLVAIAACSLFAGPAAAQWTPASPPGCPTPPADPDQARATATDLFARAEARADAGAYVEAATLFACCYLVRPHPHTLYNLGVAAEQAGDLRTAHFALERYLAEVPEAENRDEASTLLAAVDERAGPFAPDPVPGPDPVETELARRAFADAETAFAAGEYERAAARFEVAYDLSGDAQIAFNIGLCFDRSGVRARAAAWYRTYLERIPDAADRLDIEQRILALEAPDAAGDDAPWHRLRPHRLRASFGWTYLTDGGTGTSGAGNVAVDLDGFRFEADYQWLFWRGLALDAFLGYAPVHDVEGSSRAFDVWSVGAGLGWIWRSLPYVVFGVRGTFAFYPIAPQAGDLYYFVPFRAGGWIEVPILDWFGVHAGGDVGVGAYAGRDDATWGFCAEVAVGLTFSFGAVPGGDRGGAADDDGDGGTAAPPPPSYRPGDGSGRGWQ